MSRFDDIRKKIESVGKAIGDAENQAEDLGEEIQEVGEAASTAAPKLDKLEKSAEKIKIEFN